LKCPLRELGLTVTVYSGKINTIEISDIATKMCNAIQHHIKTAIKEATGQILN